MIVLSHRGFWLQTAEKNQAVAFERSFQRGFGTETDLRDHNGDLVIAHDPATDRDMTFSAFLTLHQQSDPRLPLALNIKADGLQHLLMRALTGFAPQDWFVFDMSIPDTLGWLKQGAPVFVRHSDLEPEPWLYDRAAGIWMDSFMTDWIDAPAITKHLAAGKRVCIVSPELHGRAHDAFWRRLAALDCCRSDNVMLCTDLPEDALDLFGAGA